MSRLTLRYGEDPATGLPRLHDPSGSLAAADLEELGRALAPHFERLAGGPDGQLVALNGTVGPHLPHRFRVTVADREKRCPTLVLEPVDPVEAEGPAPASTGRWQGQFLAELAELLAGPAGDDTARSPLDFVLADLRALLRKDPHKFTLLLFAGYLHVGDALSLEHGEAGDNRYARAARALAERAGTALPPGALAPLLDPPEPASAAQAPTPKEPRSWLRRFFSFC